MKLQTLALAIGLTAASLTGMQAFAQDRDVTITHQRDDGALVTKHVTRSEDYDGNGPVVHRTVRVDRPDGTTVIRHRVMHRGEYMPHRTVVIHHRYLPARHVVVRTIHHRPDYVVNRHVTVIHDNG